MRDSDDVAGFALALATRYELAGGDPKEMFAVFAGLMATENPGLVNECLVAVEATADRR